MGRILGNQDWNGAENSSDAFTEEEERRRREEEERRIEQLQADAQDLENGASQQDKEPGYLDKISEGISKRWEKATDFSPQGLANRIGGSGGAPQEPVAPVAPQVAAPNTYNRMLQAESNNQNYGPNGQPVTSPKGAMFASQVMPATAANPGYGIQPAQSQTPEEYNRVGQEYFAAMKKQFPGNEPAAVAAYNAGPGRVQQALQQGGDFLQRLPQETQNYVGKVLNAVIPSAQAGTLTPEQQLQQRQLAAQITPPMTGPQPVQPVSPEERQAYAAAPQTTMSQEMTQDMENASSNTYATTLRNPHANETQLASIIADPTADPLLKTAAKERFVRTAEASVRMNQANSLIEAAANGDQKANKTMMKETTSTNNEGSWIKALLLAKLGLNAAATTEFAKLGVGSTDQIVTIDGNRAVVTVDALGVPIKGKFEDGKQVSGEQLATALLPGKGDRFESKGMFVNPTGGPNGTPIYGTMSFDKKTGMPVIRDTAGNFHKNDGSFVDASQFRQTAVAENKKQLDLNYNDIIEARKGVGKNWGDYAQYGIEVVGKDKNGSPIFTQGGRVLRPDANGRVQVEGTEVTGRPGQATLPTTNTLGVQNVGQKEVVKKAAETIGARPELETQINDITKSIKILDSGDHNVGSTLSGVAGRGPIAQAIGSQFETKDAANTSLVMDTVNKLAADGLKTLGSNPSTVDLEFWTANKPKPTSSPELVKQWIGNAQNRIENRIKYSEEQMRAGGGSLEPSDAGKKKPTVSNW